LPVARRISNAKANKKPLKNETLVTIACGANMNFDRLRFVAERAEVGEAREAVFAVTIPEERGSFRRFVNWSVTVMSPSSITASMMKRTRISSSA
jgi:hypothetical protein